MKLFKYRLDVLNVGAEEGQEDGGRDVHEVREHHNSMRALINPMRTLFNDYPDKTDSLTIMSSLLEDAVYDEDFRNGIIEAASNCSRCGRFGSIHVPKQIVECSGGNQYERAPARWHRSERVRAARARRGGISTNKHSADCTRHEMHARSAHTRSTAPRS